MENKRIYLTGFNGLRAIAAISVLLHHVFSDTFGNWGIPPIFLTLFSDGVTLFFVISGFLITYLLLKELDVKSTIDIPKFYMRRILRIWPLYYFILLCAIFIAYFWNQQSQIINSRLWYYVFFTANIPFLTSNGIGFISHYWSIGVEEQFYLFWPWLVKMKKKILLVAVSVFILWISLKFGSYLLFTNKSIIYRFFAVNRFHCMMVGAIGAILYYQNNKYFNLIFSNRVILVLSWVLIIFAGFEVDYIPAVIRAEYIAFLSLFLIMSQINRKQKVFNLENKYFDFLGKISYGIYVIHPLVVFVLSKIYLYFSFNTLLPLKVQYPIIYLLTVGVTLLVATLTYEYLEKPFLKLKGKFTIVKSSNSMFFK